jgi:hypothetical protein
VANPSTRFQIKDRLGVCGIMPDDHLAPGTVRNIRFDDFGKAIYTIDFDDETLTTDGLFVAREHELAQL